MGNGRKLVDVARVYPRKVGAMFFAPFRIRVRVDDSWFRVMLFEFEPVVSVVNRSVADGREIYVATYVTAAETRNV